MKKVTETLLTDITKRIFKKTNDICRRHPECDRGNIYHTLVSLEQPPIKRLEMSLRRAKLADYSRRG